MYSYHIITVSAKDNFTTFKMILQIILNILLNKISLNSENLIYYTLFQLIYIYTFQNESPYKEKLADSTYNTI